MVGLQNYSGFQPVAPGKSMAETLQLIQMLNQMGSQQDARQAAQAAQAQAQAEAARQAELRAALDAAHADPTAENYARLSDLHAQFNPDKAKAFRESWAMLDTDRQQDTFRESVSMLSALETDPAVGIAKIQEGIDAAMNAGDAQEVKRYKTLLGLIQSGDKGIQAVKDSLVTTIGMMPNGKDAIDSVVKLAAERRASAAEPTVQEKRLADIGFTEAQTKKLLTDLEAAKKGGGLDPEKRFQSELALNKEYEARTKAYNESIRLNSVIKDSAASGTGAGDLALINTFIKMLDPGSVVRESEFAQAQDTAGLVSKLAASLGRVQSGEVLVPAQRQEFARLADQYMTAAGVHEKKVRDSLGFIVKSYGLNPDNVFGTMADKKDAPATTPGTSAAPATVYATPLEGMKALALQRFPEEAARINAIKDEATFQKEYGKTYTLYTDQQKARGTTAAEPVVEGTSF